MMSLHQEQSFLVPAPPPPPPAHLHHLQVQQPQVHIKAEPIEDIRVNDKVFDSESSHDEILHSEFGQAAREVVPSGRTVLGTY